MLSTTKKIAAWLSLVSNVFLTFMKIVVGLLFHSQVLIADGVHNAADVVASIVTVGSLRISSLPADDEHPYGHGKAEVIASGFIGLLLLLAALFMGFQSIESMLSPAPAAHPLGLVAAVVSLIWKEVLFLYTMKIGKQLVSSSLVATAYDHLADVYTSLAAVIGIGMAMLGNQFNIAWAKYGDSAAGIIVSILILKLAISMTSKAVDILMEKNVEPEKLHKYSEAAMTIDNVKRVDLIRAREHGNYILVDIRVAVPGNLSVQQGHDTSRQIKHSLINTDPLIREVLVHINPWYNN